MSQDAIRKWTRGWTGHVLHNFHWFGIPIFFVCWFFCDPNDNAATLSALLQDCMLTFASVSNLVLMEIQISFHMACSMPLYPLGRKKKGKKLRNGLLGLQPAQESWFCLPAHSCLHRREQSTGGNSGTGTQSCFIWASFPRTWRDGNTKEDWDFTISTQNKWVWQKRNSCLCKQKSWATTENGITRNVPALGKEPRLQR